MEETIIKGEIKDAKFIDIENGLVVRLDKMKDLSKEVTRLKEMIQRDMKDQWSLLSELSKRVKALEKKL